MRNLQIVFVGDDQVGKSSLISTFLCGSFEEHVSRVLPGAKYEPPGWQLGQGVSTTLGEGVTTTLVDTSARHAPERLPIDLAKADAVVCVYDVDRPETLTSVHSKWLPEVRRTCKNVPVVIAGNKVDKRQGDDMAAAQREVVPVMEMFQEVEYCVHCSARSNLNCSEVIFFAVKAVLLPMSPLYDVRTKELQRGCSGALRRVFAAADGDGDGVLSDGEVRAFQLLCYDQRLSDDEIAAIKQSLRFAHADCVTSAGVTLYGFLHLFKMFIERSRVETVWIALRKFGYGSNLRIREELLPVPKLNAADQTIEITALGYDMLSTVFRKYGTGSSGQVLNGEEVKALFACTPGCPWVMSNASQSQALSLHQFLTLWSAVTWVDPRVTAEYLLYFGLSSDDVLRSALTPTRRKQIDRAKHQVTRNTFHCAVLGSQRCGKTALCELLSPPTRVLRYEGGGGDAVLHAGMAAPLLRLEGGVGSPPHAPDARRSYQLLVTEVEARESDSWLANGANLSRCDALVFAYDMNDPNSLQFATRLIERVSDFQIPCVIVGTKSDLDLAQQTRDGNALDPAQFCIKRGFLPPLSTSIKGDHPQSFFSTLVYVCLHPHCSSRALAEAKQQSGRLSFSKLAIVSILIAASAIVVFQFWKRR